MQRWARDHAAASVDDLEPDYHAYVAMQCAVGYDVRKVEQKGTVHAEFKPSMQSRHFGGFPQTAGR